MSPCPFRRLTPAPPRTDPFAGRGGEREPPPAPAPTRPRTTPTVRRHSPVPPAPAGRGLLTGMGLALLSSAGALIALQRRTRALRRHLASARYEARHDRLTALPDLRSALEHLSGTRVALVGMLDLDDFKSVNDRYGHPTGDRLLVVVAERLHAAMRGHGIAARRSGDEFVLLWSPGPGDPVQHAGLVLAQVSAPVRLDTHLLVPRASLGLARPGPHLQGPALLAAADHAMYEAKATARRAGRAAGSPEHPVSRAHLYVGTHPPAPVDRRVGPDRRGTRS